MAGNGYRPLIANRLSKLSAQNKIGSRSPTSLLMQEMGLEPTRYCYHRHLKPARLPIPPLLRTNDILSNVGENVNYFFFGCLCQVFVGTFFVFRNSVEKLCVSWALPFIECVAAWALKLPVVSAPLRSLHNRSPPDFLQHIPTYSNPRVTKFFYKITGNQRNCQ